MEKNMGLIYCDDCKIEEEEEEDHLDSKACNTKLEVDRLGKKHHLILDVNFPFSSDLSIPYHIRFLNVSRHLGLGCIDLVEHGESNPLSPFCRTTSLVNIPIILRPSEEFTERFGHFRRIRSTNDLGTLSVQYPSAVASSGDVFVSLSSHYIFDSAAGAVMARPFLKSSLFSELGIADGATGPTRATSFGTSPMKTSSSVIEVSDVSSQEPNFQATSPKSQVSNLTTSERLLVSCSSTNSTSSYLSNSSPGLTTSKASLYCAWKNGSLNILFNNDDERGKAYVANFRKSESSAGREFDCLYIFHSWTGNGMTEFVGMMKVSSSVILNSDYSKSVETEFVLSGVEDHSKEVKYSNSNAEKRTSLSKKVAKVFRSNNSSKQKPTSKISDQRFQVETFLQDSALSKFTDLDESRLVNYLENGFHPGLELAGIVVKSLSYCREKDAETGGWGLKFLEKVTRNRDNILTNPSLHAETCGNLENSRSSWMNINVLIPAGFHGAPISGNSGPSSLVERWRSGGLCDCGGWDIGCPLTKLHDKSSVVTEAFNLADNLESKTIDLFVEGAKHGEPALKMVTTSEGMYTMHFKPTLTSLQAFSVGVAIIHLQAPSLRPE